MLRELREKVLEANLEVVRRGLVLYTFGNVSGIDRAENLVVIKPSGVPYERMSADDLVITDLEGRQVWGEMRPSSDLATHLHLYRSFSEIGGVVHTHSEFATAWAQARRAIPPLGTTHADYFHGPVPVTRELTAEEIEKDYVRATGVAIAECFGNRDPLEVPAALVADHGPFCWGRTPDEAVHNAVVLEAVARMASHTVSLAPERAGISQNLLDRHYFRKHGAAATYGQS
ncbi:L-ribulose-5-phosphate 4-epimerase AraD [Microvirga sp. 17 mud 1-3]|uniref:L-ribulose-5-phosphate 4-epimerase AraD n=1 Tax=Microvirga sp. 17 mud 1-3 TaxID=2082949 RepID=UPI000D6BF46B|nr:L-ribulose-5-phosphate 4-epimerase AraD [Microvirga sp. 17 mud 1-3]AWM86359.1 L-ribulose-5-phosphate 4-epimerase [Microvirga sp. 17 mud 1-3]